ncbi:hypothetical protein PRUPE_1G324500 [Prunus persica]|uniref:Uncharacterized protein n=1 Tax=Prunus persica TaxID=3760 RepID=A0A251R6J6_PRUPE|nr:hypothetical protein PRUPE_1G324500 [Prunus persica]
MSEVIPFWRRVVCASAMSFCVLLEQEEINFGFTKLCKGSRKLFSACLFFTSIYMILGFIGKPTRWWVVLVRPYSQPHRVGLFGV